MTFFIKCRKKNQTIGLQTNMLTKPIQPHYYENYTAIITSHSSIIIVKTSIPKTNSQFTAEKSSMSSIGLLLEFASIHFILVSVKVIETQKLASQLVPEERLMCDMVSLFCGGKAVFPGKPHNLLSSDDKVQYMFVGGVVGKPDGFHLKSGLSLAWCGTHSIYSMNGLNMMNGMQVKCQFTMARTWNVSMPCVAVALQTGKCWMRSLS